MDDLMKSLGGEAEKPGATGQNPADVLGSLLDGGGLASVLGGALGGGIGGSVGGGAGGALGGGLDAILANLLPAILGMLGGAAGSGGPSGLQKLVGDMEANGHGATAASWVGTGANLPITPEQVEQALGPETIQKLSAASGLPADQIHQGLSAILPALVNHLTPDGKVPTPDQLKSALAGLTGSAGGQ